MHVAQAHEHVGVVDVRLGMDLGGHGTEHRDRFGERVARVDEHVGAGLEALVVLQPAREHADPADTRGGISRVVVEPIRRTDHRRRRVEPALGVQVPDGRCGRRRPVGVGAPVRVRSLDVHLNRFATEQTGPAEQVRVEPVEGRVGRAFTASAQVPAGTDAEVDGSGGVTEGLVVGDHARQRIVVPPVDQERRDRPLGEQAAEVDGVPEPVAGARVLELILVEREVLARDVAQDIAEREVVEGGPQLGHASFDGLGGDVGHDLGGGGTVEPEGAEVPRDDDLEGQRVAGIPRVGPDGGGQRDHHGLQVRWFRGGQGPLGEAHVAGTRRAEPTVEPVLVRDPVRGGPPVGRLGEVAVVAAGAIRAPAGAQDVPVPPGRELGTGTHVGHAAPVRRAFEDRRGVGDADGVVHVGQQDRPVRHGDRDVTFDVHLIGPWPHRVPLVVRPERSDGAACCAGPTAGSNTGEVRPNAGWERSRLPRSSVVDDPNPAGSERGDDGRTSGPTRPGTRTSSPCSTPATPPRGGPTS